MVEDGTSSSMSQSHWNDEVCEKWWKHQEETRKEQGEGEVSVSASAMVEGGTISCMFDPDWTDEQAQLQAEKKKRI